MAQRQLPDFIGKLYQATLQYANNKTLTKWGKNNDPGFEYPSDVRLDEFSQKNCSQSEAMKDNVNKKSSDSKDSPQGSENSVVEEEEMKEIGEDTNTKSWWSYFLPYSYLH